MLQHLFSAYAYLRWIARIAFRASFLIEPQPDKIPESCLAISLSFGRALGSPSSRKAKTDQKRTSAFFSLRASIKALNAARYWIFPKPSAAWARTTAFSFLLFNTLSKDRAACFERLENMKESA